MDILHQRTSSYTGHLSNPASSSKCCCWVTKRLHDVTSMTESLLTTLCSPFIPPNRLLPSQPVVRTPRREKCFSHPVPFLREGLPLAVRHYSSVQQFKKWTLRHACSSAQVSGSFFAYHSLCSLANGARHLKQFLDRVLNNWSFNTNTTTNNNNNNNNNKWRVTDIGRSCLRVIGSEYRDERGGPGRPECHSDEKSSQKKGIRVRTLIKIKF